jgi:hypothetical protein
MLATRGPTPRTLRDRVVAIFILCSSLISARAVGLRAGSFEKHPSKTLRALDLLHASRLSSFASAVVHSHGYRSSPLAQAYTVSGFVKGGNVDKPVRHSYSMTPRDQMSMEG